MTSLHIQRKLDQIHLASSCNAHKSKVENLAFAVNQYQLIGSEDFIVISISDVSVWKPDPVNISTPQCKRSIGTVRQASINPLLA